MSRTILAVSAFLTLSAFLILSAFAIAKGRSQPWHDSCARFWEKHQWHELKALASNLDRIGNADPEVLLFGMLATRQLQQTEQADYFANRLLRERSLNWRLESVVGHSLEPRTISDRIRLYRTRGVLGVIAGIFLVNLLLIFERSRTGISWCILSLSVAGCALLLI